MSDVRQYAKEVSDWIDEIMAYLERIDITDSTVLANIERLSQWTNDLVAEEIDYENMVLIEEEMARVYEEIEEIARDLSTQQRQTQSVPIGKHTLPPLPYAYNALEPTISEEIMYLHHDKHHQTYVDGLNKAELMMKNARETKDYSLLKHWEKEAAFHGSGHYLHTIFWEGMIPRGGGQPKGDLLKQIEKDFGSFAAFKNHFSEAAKQVEGVGWAILVWVPRARKLEILQSELHMILTQWDTIPVLVLDVWEHAYYLQYKNNRASYVDKWWDVVNWPQTALRFTEAKKLTWKQQ
ncbi:superoxide dismutase [Peribacillus butanolivorans]|uniref:superoxide dismutase n=1 Tax=Peribacillus butanolivorans TaxID=421767 RepID=A0AAX0S159_9BACI|nr:superoxide dismutase [Peribacillus butanolivorans]AXN37392.1 superoxide dismutase [Peribacillus butanolivorans]MED3689326.1 superoxide dismutase [Peribacillus butanolivorans]PEJ31120.1 superoxide dismutase [Peribacillus butanolivorans]